jgi:hypothetical protein
MCNDILVPSNDMHRKIFAKGYQNLVLLPVIFFGLIPVPVKKIGLVTVFSWSYSSTCNIFWSCYCPPHVFWSYSSTIFGLTTVLIFGPRTVLRFWSYYGDLHASVAALLQWQQQQQQQQQTRSIPGPRSFASSRGKNVLVTILYI